MSPRYPNHLRPALTALAVLALACSNSNNGATDAGPDAGDGGDGGGIPDSGPPDSGPLANFCTSIGGSCADAASACCGNLTCQSGTCAPPPAICGGYGEACGSGLPSCCNPPDGGPLLTCFQASPTLSLCLAPTQGSACNSDADCPAFFTACQTESGKKVCDLPQTGHICKAGSTTCQPGDQLTNLSLNAIADTRTTKADPCFASGLVALAVQTSNGSEIGLCVRPVVEPPEAASPDGDPFDPTICNPDPIYSACGTDFAAAPRSVPACGDFFADFNDNDHCYEACTTGDDCDNIAWDCVQGMCKPNYCFATGTDAQDAGWAGVLSPYQVQAGGVAISADPSVLFNLCPIDAGFPTACLPQYDELLNSASGECVRVGGTDNGGWGSPCDPNPYRNNLGGLCQFGTYCNEGTCMPWCDLGSTANLQCPDNTICTAPASGPLLSSTLGASNSIGVCEETCNPYLDDTQNGCAPFATDAGQPSLGCKFAGTDSDVFPSPGACVALNDQPLAIGQACSPFAWLDPCVSGAQCLQVKTDASISFVCRQLCDPSPAPNVTAPALCQSSQSCVPLDTCSGAACYHLGDCE